MKRRLDDVTSNGTRRSTADTPRRRPRAPDQRALLLSRTSASSEISCPPLLCRCAPTTCPPAKTDPMNSNARLRSMLAGLIASLLVAAPAFAQVAASEFAARRDSLAARVRDGVVIGFGGRTPVTDFGPFYQLPAFHYLTSFDEPDAAFVMVVQNGRGTSTLFLTPIAPRRAFYYGRRPDSASVVRDFGMN